MSSSLWKLLHFCLVQRFLKDTNFMGCSGFLDPRQGFLQLWMAPPTSRWFVSGCWGPSPGKILVGEGVLQGIVWHSQQRKNIPEPEEMVRRGENCEFSFSHVVPLWPVFLRRKEQVQGEGPLGGAAYVQPLFSQHQWKERDAGGIEKQEENNMVEYFSPRFKDNDPPSSLLPNRSHKL